MPRFLFLDDTITHEIWEYIMCVAIDGNGVLFTPDEDVWMYVTFNEHTHIVDQRPRPGGEPPFMVSVELIGDYAASVVIYD